MMSKSEVTPLTTAITHEQPAVARWLLDLPEAWDQQWDNKLFEQLIRRTPSIVLAFLDKFAAKLEMVNYGWNIYSLRNIRLAYGPPEVKVDETALSIAVRWHEKKNVLWHPPFCHVLEAKWSSFGNSEFIKEFMAYFFLLLLYYATTIWAHPNWNALKDASDIVVLVFRAIAWALCVYLIVFVERKEFHGLAYFLSFWNWINFISYGAIMATIPLEFIGGSVGGEIDSARRSLLALIMVTLSLNLLQYLQIFEKTGMMIVMMSDMLRDVSQFFWFYSVFLMGFSAAFYLLFQGADGYENFINSFITVLLMLFGQVTYDPFRAAHGWIWHMSNLLLLIYLVTVVVMLLNILIAMMSTTYSLDSSAAADRVAVCRAEIILRFESSLSEAQRAKIYRDLISKADSTTKSREVGVSSSVPIAPVVITPPIDTIADMASTDNVITIDVGKPHKTVSKSQKPGRPRPNPTPTEKILLTKICLPTKVRKRKSIRSLPISPPMSWKFVNLNVRTSLNTSEMGLMLYIRNSASSPPRLKMSVPNSINFQVYWPRHCES